MRTNAEEHVLNNVPATVVPSILQHLDVGGGGVAPDVIIMQWPPSPRGTYRGWCRCCWCCQRGREEREGGGHHGGSEY